ncbi:hypothetical protein DAPPUDRAFT_108032 [Daphnia pulex]|uniref:Uncharacterized protein n=1 Tax=Daphnia pulex TaxID=6669 RepID=E9GYY2_DAPPU|nr:hypothetical protein DAPPUDRAFT_108032 [Daphnia pulex]|eukprot:EFX75327.1 hypothetical protein DAPPUDRAFT_108032 [Daphnia pulex]
MSLPVSCVVKDGLAKSLAFAYLGESVDFAFCSRIEGSISPLSISLGDRSKPFPIPVPLKQIGKVKKTLGVVSKDLTFYVIHGSKFVSLNMPGKALETQVSQQLRLPDGMQIAANCNCLLLC